ncbi:MAG TPA: F0F1 ATP synthase subunit B [Candidatus Angelobacter sp.]|nr:F0F1 ATP synthase subunit B [Candidatus Angelobacter sp.]
MSTVVADAGLITFNATLVLQIVIFVLMAVVLWRYAWGPIVRVLDKRAERIESGLRAAEESEKRLAQVTDEVQRILDETRGQAREIIARAHQEAAADADEVRSRGRRDAEAELQKALSDIAAERDRALQELRAQAAALIVEAAGRIIGQSIDGRTHQRLIEESLEKVTAG